MPSLTLVEETPLAGDLPTTALPLEPHLRPPKGREVGSRMWLLLIPGALLLVLYLFLPEEAQLAVAFGALPLSAGTLGYLIFRTVRVGKDKERGVSLMEARNLALAHQSFDELALTKPRPVSEHAESIFYLGVVSLLQSDIKGALSLFSAVAAYPGLDGWMTLNERLPGWFALAYAVDGQLPEAQAWLDVGRERCDDVSATLLLLPEAILRLRVRQDAQGAADILTREWEDKEIDIAIDMLREMGVVRAFALAHLSLGRRGEEEIQALLTSASTGPFGTLAFLGHGWPEMKTFLINRKLVPSPEDDDGSPSK